MTRTILVAALISCGGHGGAHNDAPGTGGDAPPRTDANAHDANDGGAYAAYSIIGGLDRVRVAKTLGGTCFAINLVNPGSDGKGLSPPAGWGLESAVAMQPPAACNPAYAGPIANTFTATSQSGSVAWPGATPTTVSVDATLVFAGAPSWCPASEGLLAGNIAVQ